MIRAQGFREAVVARLARALPTGSLRAKIANGAFWNLSGALFVQGSALVGSVLIARNLGADIFGQLGMVNSTVGLFGTVAGFGLGTAATRYAADLLVRDPLRLGRMLGLFFFVSFIAGVLSTSAVAITSFWLSNEAFGDASLGSPIRLASPQLFFGALSGVAVASLQGIQQFRIVALVNAIVTPLQTVAMVLCALTWKLNGAVVAMVAASALGSIVWFLVLRNELHKKGIELTFRNTMRERDVIASYAIPAFLAGLVVPLVNWIADAILVNAKGGYSELGIFNVADQWKTMLLFAPSIVMSPLLPLTTELFATGQYSRLRRALLRCAALNLGLCAIPTLITCVCAPYILAFYGPTFAHHSTTLISCAMIVLLLAVGIVTAQLLHTVGKMWLGFAFNVAWGLIAVGAAFIFVGRGYGALGLALSFLTAYVVQTTIQVLYLHNTLNALQSKHL